MRHPRSRLAKLRRRSVSLPGLALATVVVTATIPVWAPIALVVDAVRFRFRFPLARLLSFAVCWCWIESFGVIRSFGLWLRGRASDEATHYRVMSWWAGAMMTAMTATTGMRPRIEGVEQLAGGNAVILSRHASLGDSLLSGWALATVAELEPRYVLKKELLYDPCLDIVGLRVPNHFLDRGAADGAAELAELEALAGGIGPGVVGVIFAEGTRTNDRKRARALEKIGSTDPDRAARLRRLRRLLPPRPAGSAALLAGAPEADVVLVWHTGFDGLDSFGGMIRELQRRLPAVRFVARRVPRHEVPNGYDFVAWLDEQWLRMDSEVDTALNAREWSESEVGEATT